jgi:hypothetical protein
MNGFDFIVRNTPTFDPERHIALPDDYVGKLFPKLHPERFIPLTADGIRWAEDRCVPGGPWVIELVKR